MNNIKIYPDIIDNFATEISKTCENLGKTNCDDCAEGFSNNNIFRKIKIPIISICILLLIAIISFFINNNRVNGINNFL
jgi:hypothetical protein